MAMMSYWYLHRHSTMLNCKCICIYSNHLGICIDTSHSLTTHSHSPVSTNHTPRTPQPILRAQHSNHARNLTCKRRPSTSHLVLDQADLLLRQASQLRIALIQLTQRGIILEALDLVPEALSSLEVHIPRHRAGIHGIDRGSIGQFPRPGPCHSFQCGLRASIYRLTFEAESRRDRGDIHNPARAVSW